MVTASVISGSSELGKMVFTPCPRILKSMVSAPGVALAAVIASRRVHPFAAHTPLPGSTVLLTVKVVEAWAGFAVSIRPKATSAATTKPRAQTLCPDRPSIVARIISTPLGLSASSLLLRVSLRVRAGASGEGTNIAMDLRRGDNLGPKSRRRSDGDEDTDNRRSRRGAPGLEDVPLARPGSRGGG